MRNEALDLMKEQLEAAKHDIEACEIEMIDCMNDLEASESLKGNQLRYEVLADELEDAIQK
jgi:hypothetical protein